MCSAEPLQLPGAVQDTQTTCRTALGDSRPPVQSGGMNGIVVGVDSSSGAAHALRWAARESALRGLPLTALMAWDYLDQHGLTSIGFDPAFTEADASAAVDAFVRGALGASAATAVTRRVVCDRPARALLDASRDADLLVVGARGLGGFRGLLLGSVSQQCLHHATSALAIVHAQDEPAEPAEPAAPTGERIVVGIDGSGTADRALQWAVDEARLRQANLDVVHAWRSPIPHLGAAPHASMSVGPLEFERAAERMLAAAVRRVDITGLPAPVERIVTSGSAAWAILEVSKGADLVVVGSRGLGGFKGMVLGSVSHQVATHAQCPVVVIPPQRS
jgi:nucleotide-binding universal stress UspA family protein